MGRLSQLSKELAVAGVLSSCSTTFLPLVYANAEYEKEQMSMHRVLRLPRRYSHRQLRPHSVRWGLMYETNMRCWRSAHSVRMHLHRRHAARRHPWSLWHRGKFWYRPE